MSLKDGGAATAADAAPRPRKYLEKIGDREWELLEARLDVDNDVALWSDNPRLQTSLAVGDFASETQLMAALRNSPGYDTLKRSIEDLGQMEPVYVWRSDPSAKFIVFEGATRVCILRELNRKHQSGPKAGKFRMVRAKVLPENFSETERAILLARIHVRGTGVRAWGRYIEAKFIHDTVVDGDRPALMNMSEMARHMEKSLSWVQRLRDAYQFAQKFVEHVDNDEAQQLAAKNFSVLEEISKVTTLGSQLRDYDNERFDVLRADVFGMVEKDVFKEYRDARFLKEFYDDPDKWAQLKSGEKHIAARLATEVKSNSGSLKSKIAGLEQQIQRALDRAEIEFSEDDVECLERAIAKINGQLHPGVRPFRVSLKAMTRALVEASLADVRSLEPHERTEFQEALDYFQGLMSKQAGKAA